MSKKDISLRILSCCKVILEFWPKKRNMAGRTALTKENQSHWRRQGVVCIVMCLHVIQTHCTHLCLLLCPEAHTRSLTVTPGSCVIYFSSLCHMHKHGLQTRCVKQRRETDDTWWEHYSTSNIDGQHFIGVRDSKVKWQKNDWRALLFLPRSGKELCTERRFKSFPSVYTICWHEIML